MGSHGDGSVGWDDVLGRDMLWRCSGSVCRARCPAVTASQVEAARGWHCNGSRCPSCSSGSMGPSAAPAVSSNFPHGVAGCRVPFPKEPGEALGGKKARNPIHLTELSAVLFPSGQACEVPAKSYILGQMRNTCHPPSPITRERCCGCMLGPAWGCSSSRRSLGTGGHSACRIWGCDPCCFHGVPGVTHRW